MSSSFISTNAHIDDLTFALANFSRVSSPELTPDLPCCCSREECEHTRAWRNFKNKLESRLILSAEVGQALLKRHEAYVRRHENRRQPSLTTVMNAPNGEPNELELQIVELQKEKTVLERLLNQSLVNNEVSEVSNQTVLHELQEARSSIARLTAQNVRLMNVDTRLSAVQVEKDDMQQERDSETQRAKALEHRASALQDKLARLQAEVKRLQSDSEQQRSHRMEMSETILQDAKERIQELRSSQLGSAASAEKDELTNMLRSLIRDNENLKQDNGEIQSLLASSREDVHSLQQELEEQKASVPSRPESRLQHRHHQYTGSVPSLSVRSDIGGYRRRSSLERKFRYPLEPLSPASLRPHLPSTAPSTPSENHQPSTPYAASFLSMEVEDESASPYRTKTHKSLLLLSRSRGVQTEPEENNLLSIPGPPRSEVSSPSIDPRSESSSFSDSQSSHISTILERTASLLNRITSADALTLTNRLKRQHLVGADVGHISRTTIHTIVSEASALRNQYRALLEDEKISTTCSRNDLRRLFKLVRDMFVELGQLRISLNEIVLDPSIAPKVSQQALHPSAAEAQRKATQDSNGTNTQPGWMAPISKLFGTSTTGSPSPQPPPLSGLNRHSSQRLPPRVAPKLGPALAASTTTVNVEFSGTGVGRTNTVSIHAPRPQPTLRQAPSSSLLGIFAGAQRTSTPDPWVLLPSDSAPRVAPPQRSAEPSLLSNGKSNNRFSRNVDAVIDASNTAVPSEMMIPEEEDSPGPQPHPQRLRRRGLSDSSIHSTFMARKEETYPTLHPDLFDNTNTQQRGQGTAAAAQGTSHLPHRRMPDRGDSMFQTLSRRVQSFRFGGGGEGSEHSEEPTSPNAEGGRRGVIPRLSSPPLRSLLPDVSIWPDVDSLEHYGGSTRESDALLHGSYRPTVVKRSDMF